MNKKYFDIVYLGLQPVSSKSEGLHVLLCDLIKPLLQSDITVSIHTTNRHKRAIEDALVGNSIDLMSIEINAYNVGSAVIPFLTSRGKRKKNEGKFFDSYIGKKIYGAFKNSLFLTREFFLWVLDASFYTLPFKLMFALALLTILAPLISIIILIFSSLVIPYITIKYIKAKVKKAIIKFRSGGAAYEFLKPIAKLIIYKFINEINNILYEREQIRFIKTLSRKKRIDKLFFFTCFEGSAIKEFKGKSLVVFPDIVTAVFPMRFHGAHNSYVLDSVKNAVVHSDSLVCYSNYVRDEQLIKYFNSDVKYKKITVIPQGYFAPKVLSYSKMDSEMFFNKSLLNSYNKYLKNLFPDLFHSFPIVDFNNFSYILYPTVDRPHKNTLTLVRAFNILLRKKHRNLKLILTTPALTREVEDYIRTNRLHYDIMIIPSVPVEVLDDLFMGASLMVHPSLAEGGDIFNFSRAVSVACPALMADIPVVREMFDRKNINNCLYKNWLFDPFDHENLAELIDKTINDPKLLLDQQIKTLKELSVYGYTEMAQRYFETYEGL